MAASAPLRLKATLPVELGEQIRLLLAYLEVDFIDRRYKIGPALTYHSDTWLPDKFSLGLEFPNLPYYIDGDFKLTHLRAIVEFIAEVHGMLPECKKQRAVLHMLQCEIMDLRMPFIATFFGPDCQVGILDGAVVVLCVSSGRVCQRRCCLLCVQINYPDFALCDLLMQMTKSEPTYLQGYPKLQAYLWRFELRISPMLDLAMPRSQLGLAPGTYVSSVYTTMAPILGYWDIKGLGEQIRLLLKYLGVEFVDKQYKLGPPPTYDKSGWLPDKFSLGLDIPNLPYYIDGDFKLTQSGAIMEYIADIHSMIPECKKRRAVLHMLQCEIVDLRMAFGRTYYSPDIEKLKPAFFETLAQKLPQFEAYLGEKQWLTGEKINYPDFALCDLLMQMMGVEPTCLRKHPILQAYLSRFKNLPELEDYLASK
ncbi:unnamed protein product [Taenia asiatica]|uniref:glutathione transferase n=1 Tax=Taenia asiatica TaxID=60517 RepID=A0A158R9Q3_TAEAS|nr:unnamed protein product [Taenia asiatica]